MTPIEVPDMNFPEQLAKTVGNLPDTALMDNREYFFDIRHPDWKDGAWHRVRRKFRDAKRLVNLVGWEVNLSKNQTGPSNNERGVAGSQKALIYGGRTKKKGLE